MFEAVILAGGLGTRLKSVVADVPKPMAPVAGVPFLEHLLQLLLHYGCTRAVISVGHKKEVVINYFGDNYSGLDIVYVEEEQPLGTGGAVKRALSACRSDWAFVLNGDTFLAFDFRKALHVAAETTKPQIIGKIVEDTSRYGRLDVQGDKLVGFLEKGMPGRGLINGGAYLLNKQLFDDAALPEKFSMEQDFIIPRLDKLDFRVLLTEGYFIDIGIPEDFYKANRDFAEGKQGILQS